MPSGTGRATRRPDEQGVEALGLDPLRGCRASGRAHDLPARASGGIRPYRRIARRKELAVVVSHWTTSLELYDLVLQTIRPATW